MPDVVAVGNVNIDVTARLPRWPGPDEKLVASSARVNLGGAAANFAIACSRLGLSSGLVAVVGADPMGEMALRALEAEGIDVSHIARAPGTYTGVALILWAGQSRGIVSCRGANDLLAPEHLDEGYLASARLVLGASIRLEVAEALASVCARHGVPLLLDPGGTLAEHRLEELASILPATRVFSPNEVELVKITGRKDIREACEVIWATGVELVVVKAGPRGCYIYDGHRLTHVDALEPERAVDPTGAGDAFNAAFSLGLLMGLEPPDCARLGVALATLKLGRPGASNMPGLAELVPLLSAVGWGDLAEALSPRASTRGQGEGAEGWPRCSSAS